MNIRKKSAFFSVVVFFFSMVLAAPHLLAADTPDPIVAKKIGGYLQLQLDMKTSYLEGPTPLKLKTLEKMGMPAGEPSLQRVFIHFAEKPTEDELDELRDLGVTPYMESWIPSVGNHPTGFIVADVPVDGVLPLAEKRFVSRITSAERRANPLNDEAAMSINADDLWNTFGLDGSGVTIAVLDSGLDILHPDVPTPTATKDYSGFPSLDDTIANTVTDHGTHVTGSAVGLGTQSSGQYQGMAPGANLVFLKVGDDASSNATFAAMSGAMRAAVDTYNADIVTMSYGGYDDYHDGSSEAAQGVDYAFSQGALVFISAGNTADDDTHFSGTVSGSSTSPFIQVNVSQAGTNAVALLFNTVWSDGTGTSRDLELDFFDSTFTLLTKNVFSQTESSRGTESQYASYEFYVPPGDSIYYLQVTNNSASSQMYHLYYSSAFNAGSGSVTFQSPSSSYTINSPADADNAIAVGAYTTRVQWTDWQGSSWISNTETLGSISSFSSRGPRIDEDKKPEIAAPGAWIISLRDSVFFPGNQLIIDNDGINDGLGPADYAIKTGTSMACPIAAGATALLYEAYPSLMGDPSAAMNLIQSTASNGGTQNNTSGFGYLDILAAHTTGPTQTTTSTTTSVSTTSSTSSTSSSTSSTPGGGCPLRPVAVEGLIDEEEVELFRQFRNRKLTVSLKGWRYIYLYYVHGEELSRVLERDPELMAQVGDFLKTLTPTVESTLRGEQATVTSETITEAETILDAFEMDSGAKLRSAIERIRQDLADGEILEMVGIAAE